MSMTHNVRVEPLPATGSSDVRPAPSADRRLWTQVAVAVVLGATAGVLGTWAVVATQTLQMHL